MTDTDLQSTIDNLYKSLAENAIEEERLGQVIAYQKKLIKEFEKEQQRRKKWAKKTNGNDREGT